MDKAEAEYNEKREENYNEIKQRFDRLSQTIKIDSKGLIQALLKKKDVSIAKTFQRLSYNLTCFRWPIPEQKRHQLSK